MNPHTLAETDPTIVALEALADRLMVRGDPIGAWTIRGTIDGLLGEPDATSDNPEPWAAAYRTARQEALALRGCAQ